MIAITEGLLLFSDILDYRKSRIEEKNAVVLEQLRCFPPCPNPSLYNLPIPCYNELEKRIHILTWFGQKNITTLYESTS